jgi:predicted RNA-binding protein with TRAM domain
MPANIVANMSYGGRGRYGGGGGGGYGGDRGFGGPKPVETGKQYDVQITEISRQGDGIARIQGFVIFVKGGKVGQKPKIRITNVGARFATAEVVGEGQATTTTAASPSPSQQQQQQGQQAPKDIAPQESEADKPELSDYKSEEEEQSAQAQTETK